MRRELTWQAVVIAVIVAALVSASYPYVLLKLGIGPNVSVVSAFLGAVGLLILARGTHGQNRLMNNIVQTAGTSAAMTAFMCVIAAAVDLANQNPVVKDKLNDIHTIEPWPMFWWLTCAGGIGVLFTVIFRRHFLDDSKLVFADGVAAAETIVVLDSPGREGHDKLAALGLSSLASAVVYLFREGFGMFKDKVALLGHLEFLPDWYPRSGLQPYRVGVEWNLLSIGGGMLIGINVCLSMLIGTLIVAIAGPYLVQIGIGREIVLRNVADRSVPRMQVVTALAPLAGGSPLAVVAAASVSQTDMPPASEGELVNARQECERLIDKPWKELTFHEQAFISVYGDKQANFMKGEKLFNVVLLWFMWPATGLMIFSAITAVLLKWRSVIASFTQLRAHSAHEKREDVSLTTILVGSAILTVLLAVIQERNFGLSYVQTAVAVLCTLPLILVGNRVLGETNFGPISVMMNGLQAIFAVFWPASVGHNLIAAGMSGSCNSQGQGTIQDYKTGQIIGSTPRILTWVQLAAVPIGAAAVAIMYPRLTRIYVIGETLAAPTALKVANMAVLLSQGIDALPQGALLWTVLASLAGILIVLVKHFANWTWLPSPTGLGLGLIIGGTTIVPFALGGIIAWFWEKAAKSSYDRYYITVASGLIAGEALLAGVVVPILAWIIL
jgi:uncharacterized oligopeptide transporter (OPT) family protein